MTKLINLAKEKEELKKYSEVVTYDLDENTHITFTPFFSNTEISKMVQTMAKVKLEKLPDTMTFDFILFHAIKHFTILGNQLKSTTLKGQLAELETIIDLEFNGVSLFKIIVEEMFLPDQIKKVQDFLFNKMAETELTKRMVQQSVQTLQDVGIDNDEIKIANLLGD